MTTINEFRSRLERLDLIRREKFDFSLPRAMRDNKIDMWIHVVQHGNPDALAKDLGADFPGRRLLAQFPQGRCETDMGRKIIRVAFDRLPECGERRLSLAGHSVGRAQDIKIPNRVDGTELDSSVEHFYGLFSFSGKGQRMSELSGVFGIVRSKGDGPFR